jgi:hypothetical protein
LIGEKHFNFKIFLRESIFSPSIIPFQKLFPKLFEKISQLFLGHPLTWQYTSLELYPLSLPMSSTYLAFRGYDEKGIYVEPRWGNTHQKECLRLRNHIIFVTIFPPIDLKKSLNRRDIDERFHVSTAQDKVKISIKAPWGKQGLQGMAALIHLVSLSMDLHLCCLKFLALLQVWLCLRTSKSSSLGDVLALIKHQFHASTCWVNV